MSTSSTPSKIPSALKYAVLFIAALFLVLFIAYFSFTEFSRHSMRAMNCEQYSREEFDSIAADIQAKPIYTSTHKNSTFPVTFKFDFSPLLLEDVFFVIKSGKINSIVYRATYQNEIVIQAGNELLEEDGYDNLTLSIFKKKSHKICTSVYEAGQFWQTKKIIHIDLLPFREINPRTNLPVSFKLWTE